MKKMFVTVDNDVRTADVAMNVHSRTIQLVPMSLVCQCDNSETAFFIAAVLNNLFIGNFWEGWETVALPWTTDESNEFIYNVNGNVVTRITNEASQLIDTRDFCTNEDRKLKTNDRKAKLLLNMINALYEPEPYRNMIPEESKQSIPASNTRKQLTDDEIAWAICQVFENIPPIYRGDKLTKHINRELPRLRNQLMDIHLGNYVDVENLNYVARWSKTSPASIYTLKISDGCGWYQLVELQFATPSTLSKSEFFLSNIETWNAEGNKRNIWSA